MSAAKGKLFVLSGPSGSGKSTVIDRLLAESPLELVVCPSATTRAPRADDQHAKKYIHMDHSEFDRARRDGELLEWAEVSGHWYGTPRQPVDEALAAGRSVLLEIDVQGGMAVKNIFPAAVMIFLRAESIDEYERRIRRRGTNSEDDIERRLAAARRELEAAAQYDYQVTNDDLDRTVGELRNILERLGGTARV
jgi:guanylate kinase